MSPSFPLKMYMLFVRCESDYSAGIQLHLFFYVPLFVVCEKVLL